MKDYGNACVSSAFTYDNDIVTTNTRLDYHGIFDGEPDKKGWDKCTIDFAVENENRLKSYIRKSIRNLGEQSKYDVNDIYQDLMVELYKTSDFKLLSGTRVIKNVGNYVFNRLGFLLDTYRDKQLKKHKRTIDPYIKDKDGEYIAIFDNIADKNDDYEAVMYENVESFLVPLEPRRNEFGFDLFQILYIKILGNVLAISDDKCLRVISLLNNGESSDLKDGYKRMSIDEDVISVIKAINTSGKLVELERHVDGAEQIKSIMIKLKKI